MSYLVRVTNGDMWHQHIDDIQDGAVHPQVTSSDSLGNEIPELEDNVFLPDIPSESSNTLDDHNTASAVQPVPLSCL